MKTLHLFAIAAGLVLAAWPAHAASDLFNTINKTETGDLAMGARAVDEGRYDDALKLLAGHAKEGDAQAQFLVGFLYWNGFGVAKDTAMALHLFRVSAEQGENGRAMNAIGYAYQMGQGVSADPAQAASWYGKAGEAGEPRGLNNLANLTAQGLGVPKDLAKACALWRDAAAKGDGDAMVHLGDAYWYGKGVAADKDAAMEWWRKAAADSRITFVAIGKQYLLGKGVSKDASVAAELFARAAASGDSATEGALGWMIYNGEGVPKDAAKAQKMIEDAARAGIVDAMVYAAVIDLQLGNLAAAAEWSRQAAEKGNARGEAYYGVALLNGAGTGMDLNDSVLAFKESAGQGDAMGEFYLGRAYETGQGILSKDDGRARQLFAQSAAQGYAPALMTMGELYQEATSLDQHDEAAAKFYREAAEQGDPVAMIALGAALTDGRGVAKDLAQAAHWYERAAQTGQPNAMHTIAGMEFAGIGAHGDAAKAYVWAKLALRFYRSDDADDVARAAELRSGLLPSIERAIPAATRKKLDGQIAAFKPEVWSAPPPPLAASAQAGFDAMTPEL
jgi:TPR repeat protein